jgi:STE24 endopeptidase
MDPNNILLVIVAITLVSYVFDQILDWVNIRSQRVDIPPEVSAFYETDKYLKSLAYHREVTRFSFLTSALSFILSMGMLVTGGFGWVDSVLRTFVTNETLLAIGFFGVLMLASDLLTIPFQWYSTFVIEAKYGFNNTTARTFVLDKLKGYVLTALIGGGLLTLLIFLVGTIGSSFWIWFSAVAAAFILFVNMFYTSLILPLFNKLTPLPDGDLKDAINNFARNVNFPLDSIFVIDGSKRSKKANAFFSGI